MQRAKTGGVGATGLLHEDVLAGGYRGGVMLGAEAGRRGQQDEIDAALDGLLISVQAHEDPVGGNIDLFGKFPLQIIQATFGPIFEGVGQGHHLDLLAQDLLRGQAVRRRAGAAPAAADQGNLQNVASCRVGAAGDAQGGGRGAGRYG